MKWSPEMTFHLARAPYEITNQREGEKLIAKINRALRKGSQLCRITTAKLDPFHSPWDKGGTSWCVEVVPFLWYEMDWLDHDWRHFKAGIKELFKIMRGFGLVPTLMRRKGDEEVWWPGGGCHIHYGANFLPDHVDWFKQMDLFTQNIYTDYANRPYIRWLFSHWFADEGSHIAISKDAFTPEGALKMWMNPRDAGHRSHAICPRLAGSAKGSYLTYEFRMFSMIQSPEELRLIVRFVEAWVNHHAAKVVKGEHEAGTLTVDKFQRWKSLRNVRADVNNLLDILHLPCSRYDTFINRNLARRIKWGKLV